MGLLKKRRISIIGSSFDPIHYGHVASIPHLLNKGLTDEVWLCPSPVRWDKAPVAPEERRLLWAQKVAHHLKSKGLNVFASGCDLEEPEYRGSYFLLKKLSQEFPKAQFQLILGSDSYANLHLWRDPVKNELNGDNIKAEFPIIVIPRYTGDIGTIPALKNIETLGFFPDNLDFENISSSTIRKNLSEGRFLQGFTFDFILDDIKENNPYVI